MLPLALLRVVPLWVYPAVALLAWGGCSSYEKQAALRKLEKRNVELAQQQAEAQGAAREKERLLSSNNVRISDELAKTKAQRAAAAGTAEQRLRELAAAWAASAAGAGAGTSCRNDGVPIAAVLRDEDRRAFVALAEEADSVADRLRACQAWVNNVKSTLK